MPKIAIWYITEVGVNYLPGYVITVSRYSPEKWRKASYLDRLLMRIDDLLSIYPKTSRIRITELEASRVARYMLKVWLHDCVGLHFEVSDKITSPLVAFYTFIGEA